MVRHVSNRQGQRGAALLLMMLVIVVGASAVLVSKLNQNAAKQANLARTQSALAEAKGALLAYASSIAAASPGVVVELPCPDLDGSGVTGDGEAHTDNCGGSGISVLGRLPWRTLNMHAPHDGAYECLWYVVSGEYKAAGSSTSPMINPDTNGQLQVFQQESGAMIEGTVASERPIAILMAPGKPVSGQTRQISSSPSQQCSGNFTATDYLEGDSGTGISNAVILGAVGIDQFVHSSFEQPGLNDRIVTVSRVELADQLFARHDFENRIRGLTQSIAQCVAAYGAANTGGVGDHRLPWAAPVALGDYRADDQYDDSNTMNLSGRLADFVDDSNSMTGNSIIRVLSNCSAATVPGWTAEANQLWQNWKDHFFYFVAEDFSPVSSVPNVCGNCISVNGIGQYAAVILFANRRLSSLNQLRDYPPIDSDTRNDVRNYLEGSNSLSHPHLGGVANLDSRPADNSFNDILYCVDTALNVSAC